MKHQENLLPGTRALPAGCVESTRHEGKILVRYRHLDGMTERQSFTDANQADNFFQNSCNRLAAEARARRTRR